MPRFLFWNYRYDGPDREELLARIVQAEAVDVLILAESSVDRDELLGHLGSQGRPYVALPVPHYLIEIFAGYPEGCFPDWARDEGRLCLRKFKAPGHVEILLGAVHLVSGLHRERPERKDESDPLARAVREAQRDLKHARTIVVGDFNLNPYDDGMIFPARSRRRERPARHLLLGQTPPPEHLLELPGPGPGWVRPA
jgi:endonuclease/exonuclease/phosphatase (EEP) superfamily protein YafD